MQGKKLLSAITVGSGAEFYSESDYTSRYPISYFLLPFEQLSFQCGMTYLDPLIFTTTKTATMTDVISHASAFKELVVSLRDGGSREAFNCGIKK